MWFENMPTVKWCLTERKIYDLENKKFRWDTWSNNLKSLSFFRWTGGQSAWCQKMGRHGRGFRTQPGTLPGHHKPNLPCMSLVLPYQLILPNLSLSINFLSIILFNLQRPDRAPAAGWHCLQVPETAEECTEPQGLPPGMTQGGTNSPCDMRKGLRKHLW